MSLSEQLTRLLTHYKFIRGEGHAMRATLDNALREVAATVGENVGLVDKLRHLLDEYRRNQDEANEIKKSLNTALKEVAITVGENENLSDKLRHLLEEYRRMSENEQQLRAALKRQYNSLQAAYDRVKEVEGELSKANAASAEQREMLVTAALSALQQLRTRLGQMHGFRQEVTTKPVEEAIIVKKMTASASPRQGMMLHQSSSMPVMVKGSASVPGMLPINPAVTPLAPADPRANPRLEAFMERVADTVGVNLASVAPAVSISTPSRAFPPVSPYWSVTSSRPAPDVPGGGRYRELSPVAMPRVPKPGGRQGSQGAHGTLLGGSMSASEFASMGPPGKPSRVDRLSMLQSFQGSPGGSITASP